MITSPVVVLVVRRPHGHGSQLQEQEAERIHLSGMLAIPHHLSSEPYTLTLGQTGSR